MIKGRETSSIDFATYPVSNKKKCISRELRKIEFYWILDALQNSPMKLSQPSIGHSYARMRKKLKKKKIRKKAVSIF